MKRSAVLPALMRPGMYAGEQGNRNYLEWLADAVAAYLSPGDAPHVAMNNTAVPFTGLGWDRSPPEIRERAVSLRATGCIIKHCAKREDDTYDTTVEYHFVGEGGPTQLTEVVQTQKHPLIGLRLS